jgi:hypothetical protein
MCRPDEERTRWIETRLWIDKERVSDLTSPSSTLSRRLRA